MIQKIREGIKNGTIIKEMKPDGTYIWRKVKKIVINKKINNNEFDSCDNDFLDEKDWKC
jgi:hypothetical protein